MSKFEKLLFKLLAGNADNNFSFDDLRTILAHFDFVERAAGGSIEFLARKVLKKL